MTSHSPKEQLPKSSPSARRFVRTAATVASLFVSVVLLILWGRNSWRSDVAWVPLPHNGHVVFASQMGQLAVTIHAPRATTPIPPRNAAPRWGAESYAVSWDDKRGSLLPFVKPFRFRRVFTNQVEMQAPYWFLILLSFMLAVAPWVRWSMKFTLRTLLIATTIIAVVIRIYATSKW